MSAQDVEGLTQALHSKLSIASNGSLSLYQSAEQLELEYTIDYQNVRQSIDSLGNQIFTFGLFDKDNDPKTFLNMILKKDIDEGYQTPYLLRFEMTDEFYQEFLQSRSLLNFEGTINKLAISAGNKPTMNQANIEHMPTATSTVDCGDGKVIQMTRKYEYTTSSDTNNNPGSSGLISTTTEVCEYFLVTVYRDVTITTPDGGTYTYRDVLDTYIDSECEIVSLPSDFNQLTANTSSDPCSLLNDDVGVFYPNEDYLLEAEAWAKDICLKDSFQQDTCVMSIWNELTESSTIAYDIINIFSKEKPNIDLCLKIGNLQDNSINGNAGLSGTFTNPQVTVTLNNQNLNRSKLGIARTLIHELIHSEILSKVAEGGGLSKFEDYLSSHPNTNDFENIWNYFNEYGQDTTTTWQHELMADYYINALEVGVKSLAPKLLSELFINEIEGTTLHPMYGDPFVFNWDEFYNALAWQGLQNTFEYQIKTEKERAKLELYWEQINYEISSFKCN